MDAQQAVYPNSMHFSVYSQTRPCYKPFERREIVLHAMPCSATSRRPVDKEVDGCMGERET